MIDTPTIISLPSHGASNLGYITVSEHKRNIPFAIERVYWTYYTPNNVERGGHAHHQLVQVLIAVSGIIDVDVESRDGEKNTFILNSPDKGLLLPPPYWHTMRFSHNAVLLSLANMIYDEADYIRDYQVFKQFKP